MRIALIHDWLNGMRGGEKVFEVLCELFPRADVFTLFYEPLKVSPLIRSMKVRESPVARFVPGARRHYRWLLPFMPSMIEAMRLKDYDLAVSTSHCVAKGIKPEPENTPHVCYCFTPMRYVWDKYHDYFGDMRRPSSWLMPLAREPLQKWDTETAADITQFLTSSEYVRGRIREHLLRDALVIPPPVDYAKFGETERSPGDFFLTVSALEPYKRVDVAIEAFRELGLPLKIAGSGTRMAQLRRAAPPNVEFLGWVSDEALASLYSCARALIFPQDEDFGIVPLEAASSGCPVIAYGHGGAMETIADGETGIFFCEQTPECLADAVRAFRPADFDSAKLRAHARLFDRPVFKQRMADTLSCFIRPGAERPPA
ncbi:MAG: glycosyltransferase [Candidatus Sumerlaeota bacterium]|nr:glycosyltransferase [Candidatus Sumerlaeota bacterium]